MKALFFISLSLFIFSGNIHACINEGHAPESSCNAPFYDDSSQQADEDPDRDEENRSSGQEETYKRMKKGKKVKTWKWWPFS